MQQPTACDPTTSSWAPCWGQSAQMQRGAGQRIRRTARRLDKRATARCDSMSLRNQGGRRAAGGQLIERERSTVTAWGEQHDTPAWCCTAAALSSVKASLRRSQLRIETSTKRAGAAGNVAVWAQPWPVGAPHRAQRAKATKGGGPRELRGPGTGTRGVGKSLPETAWLRLRSCSSLQVT